MKRLEDCWKMYPDKQVYILPEGKIEAFFDGDVMLEGEARPQVDEIKRQARPPFAPVFKLRALVSL